MAVSSLIALAVLLASPGPCRGEDPPVEPGGLPGLDRLVRLTDGVYAGSAPRGQEGLESLRRLGIRTILSVDATPPPADEAAARGMRCVHVPIGYDTIEPGAAARIAKVIRDLPTPLFIHCHHGRYRGPAAAAFGLRAVGRLDRDGAVAAFAAAGDPAAYPGLLAAVADGPVPAPHELDALTSDDLTARARVGDLAALMAALDHHLAHLGDIAAAGWIPPPNHPDLVPAAEAAAVVDHLRMVAELPHPAGSGDEFISLLDVAIAEAARFEDAVLASDFDRAPRHRETLSAACRACHVRYRDDPSRRTNRKRPEPDRKP